MNPDQLPRTKSAVKSSTLISAIAALLGSIVTFLLAYQNAGTEGLILALAAEATIVISQIRVITERIRGNSKPIRGLF